LHPHIPKKYAAVQSLVLPRIWDIFEREQIYIICLNLCYEGEYLYE